MSVVPAPADPVLGSRLELLLDPAAVRERLARELPGCTGVELRYARYKPRTSFLVQYGLAFDDGRSTLAHARVFADGRAERVLRSASFARVVRRARRRHPHPPQPRAIYLDDARALVELFPVDSRLPALAHASSGRTLRRFLGKELADELAPGLKRSRPELVRYKPGRKALLRYDTDSAAVYAKLHADGRAPASLRLAERLRAAGLRVAPPLAHVPGLGAALFAEAPGGRLADLRGSTTYSGWLEDAAAALAALHDVPPPPGLTRRDEPARARSAARAVASLLPELAPRAEALGTALADELAALPWRPTLVHGDYYDDQLLVGEAGTVVLDLDEAAVGDPHADAGVFLAHLTARGDEDQRDLFLAACARQGLDAADARLHEAASLLALAVGPFRRLEPAWPDRCARVFELAAARFGELRPRDERLPQLRTLCDGREAGALLGRALGQNVEIASVAAARHKQGRRCTLRYRLREGGELFVKTYGSDRGARVHETLRTLAQPGTLPVAKPLAWLPEVKAVVLSSIPGAPAARSFANGDRALAREAAEVLHALHATDAVLPRRRMLADELAPLVARVAELVARAPRLAGRARACLGEIQYAALLAGRWRLRPCHGDFYEDQLLVSEEGLALVDLDDAAMSDPAVDVANLLAHLDLLTLRRRRGAEAAQDCAEAFADRYRELDPELDDDLLRLLRGATLLRLAGIHVARADGGRLAPLLLDACERALTGPKPASQAFA